METTGTATLTVHNITPNLAKKILELTAMNTDTNTTTKRGKRTKPEPTITDEDEEETDEFSARTAATKTKKKAKATDEEDETQDDEEETTEEDEDEEETEEEESEEESEDDEEEESVSFADVKRAIDKHGDKKPKEMKALLSGFNIKSTAELKTNKKKWGPVLKKINSTFSKKNR